MRLAQQLLVLAAFAPLCACSAPGTVVVAKVEAIQRNCEYTVTTTKYKGNTATGSSARDAKMDCSEEPSFQKIRAVTAINF